MLDLRRSHASWIGIASAAAAMTATALIYGPDPTFMRPVVYAMTVAPDTVWFCSEVYPSLAQTTHAFIRGSREWRRLDVVNAPCAQPRSGARTDYSDTVRLGPRVISVAVRAAPNSDGTVVGRGYLRIDDSVSGKRIELKPVIESARVRRYLEPGVGINDDTVATYIRGIAFSDTLLWLGLAGGFSEGQGTLGGIYRIDRRTGVSELLLTESLASHTVTGLVSTGNWLWAGTENPAEYGAYGDAGLLRMDQQTRAWKAYTGGTSPIPDALIRGVASDGRIIAVATEKGIVVIELALRAGERVSTGDDAIARWNVQYFVPKFVGDSMVFDLGSKSEAPLDMMREAPFTFVQRFAPPGRERLVHEWLNKVPPDSLQKAAFDYDADASGRAIADPALGPAFVALLFAPGEGQLVAAAAIGAMGSRAPRDAVAALRRAFLASDSTAADPSGKANRGPIGAALRAVGDSLPTQWARGALEEIVRSPSASPAADRGARSMIIRSAALILSAARDPLGLTLLMSVTPVAPADVRPALVDAFMAFDSPQAWGAVVSFARSGHLPKSRLMQQMAQSALSDPAVGARIREMLGADLAGTNPNDLMNASMAIQRLRLIEFAPALVEHLASTSVHAPIVDFTYRALISLSGRSDAPSYRGAVPPDAVAWWKSWLVATEGKRVAVSAQEGDKALSEWMRRR